MSDIEISVRINNFFRVNSNLIRDGEIEYTIMEAVRKKVKNLSIDVRVINEPEQEAIDIGKSILRLIDQRTEDRIRQLSISRD